ncbi:protein NDR1-like [Magnolia sinica]|uniref:protein NDR1-like n=1 Tax=Magnolia sinica TaxID=86752 RepID=UPI00265968D9|nr:protein NDR1-like [Magnolia sinica]
MLECRSFYLWLAQVLFLIGLIALLLWVSLRPKHPTYTIIDLSVPALNGRNTTLPVDNGSMNTTVDFFLEIANPNKESGIYYNDINVTIYFEDENVGATTISSFYQGYDKSIQRQESVYTNRRFSKAVYRAVSDRTMDLKVGVATKVRYKTWGLKSKHHGMDLQGTVKIGSDGKIYGKKKIKLHHTPKKWRLHFTGRD